MKKILIIVGIIVCIIILVPILVLGYYGFVPGVSSIMGANKPKDLGVKFTDQTYKDGLAKIGARVETRPAGSGADVTYSGVTNVDANFTQEELSSFITDCPGTICLIDNAQVKIHADGQVELSGVLRLDRVTNFAKALGYSDSDLEAAKKYVNVFQTNPSIYVNGTASVINNHVSLNVAQTKIGRVWLPDSFVKGNDGIAESVLDDQLSRIPGASIQTASFENGKLNFVGTLPAVQSYIAP